MSQRLPCSQCGEPIHPDTAAKNGGLCMPCKGGYRQRIEEGKRRREQERAYEQSDERKYWVSLVHRIHETPEGFDGLAEPEKLYYAVSCLIGEVHNGGFDQFFSNSTGAMYGYALSGLFELEAEASAALLVRAKEVLFGESPVPVDRTQRAQSMPTVCQDNSPVLKQLDKLDVAFYADPDLLAERCKAYALKHQLYADG